MTAKFLATAIALVLPISWLAAAPDGDEIFEDKFSDPEFAGREAQRGDWKYADGVASCVSDPELYKKFKNHGPIIRWPAEFTEGMIEFSMKSKDCNRVVFTLNGDGHVFRVIHGNPDEEREGARKVPSRLIAWAEKSSKTNKGSTLKPDGLPELAALDGKWTKVKLAIMDGKAQLTIGESFSTELDHAALRRAKKEITLSCAFGELAVKGFKFTKM